MNETIRAPPKTLLLTLLSSKANHNPFMVPSPIHIIITATNLVELFSSEMWDQTFMRKLSQ
jgi:hypothetical protein